MIDSLGAAEFRQKHAEEISSLAKFYRNHLLKDIMPFWDRRVVDQEHGGYLNDFDREGNCTGKNKYGWFIGRNIYTYSALYRQIEKRPEWLKTAEVGYRYLKEKALRDNYRVNFKMDAQGNVLSADTSIFTDHFAVKGLFEYAAASGSEEAKGLAEKMLDALLANVKNEKVLLTVCPDPRFRKHAVNFLNLLVGIEGKSLFPEKSSLLLEPALHDSLYAFANSEKEIPLEYITRDAAPLLEGIGRTIDPGHSLESLWFALREGTERGDPEICKRAETIIDWVINWGWDDEYGGFYQNVDAVSVVPEEDHQWNQYPDAKAHWQDKIWWVQAEGLYTLAFSALINSNEHHWEYFKKLHKFCQDHFMDQEYGEWYSILKRDGSIRSNCKGTESKGPYHIPRCVMQLTILFEKYTNGNL